MLILLTILLVASPLVMCQQPGTLTPEVHPPINYETCAADGKCTAVHGEIVLDAEWRWLHNAAGQNCFANNKWDATSCPDNVTCAKNCFYEGANYTGYGVSTSGNTLDLKFGKEFGSRLYLASNESTYQLFHLMAQEFTFDVDVSTLPCGMNAALYLISMESDAGSAKHPTNKAGAKYGTGYCDSQCPKGLKFMDGQANSDNTKGACCAEMDLWEANSFAAAYTPHPCDPGEYTLCTGDVCGANSPNRYAGICDPDGCGYNSYAAGATSFYGPGLTVDTNKPFTVVTQFITSDGTPKGTLTDIRRFYVQGGKVIPNSAAKSGGNSATEAFCSQFSSFTKHGGLKQMGVALAEGMVLSFSIWDDAGGHMLWLDGAPNGPCSATSGSPDDILTHPNLHVAFSNMRVGPINSTFTH